MEGENLEFRMYGLVPYNISPIQQAIQYGHAVQEYNNAIIEFLLDGEGTSSAEIQDFHNFDKWRKEDKTFIVLNGGTTNDNINSPFYGTMNQHLETLMEAGVAVATFYEPDLGDQLSAIVFLVDERVWNKKKYPDCIRTNGLITNIELQPHFTEWFKQIGGNKNWFLRNFLQQFKLA